MADDIFSQLILFFQWLWAQAEVKILLGHIALNTIAAVAASMYTGEFLLAKFGEFLYRKVAPYLLLYGGFALFGHAVEMPAMATTVFVALEAMLVADLVDNLKKVALKRSPNLGGRVPKWLTKERLE